MAVGSLVRVFVWQIHHRDDPPNNLLISANAPIREDHEALGLRVVHDATSWCLLIFNLDGRDAILLEQYLSLQMTARMG
jgi:hypothetical protein